MVDKIVKLANNLDARGFHKEAAALDDVLRSLIEGGSKMLKNLDLEKAVEVIENPSKLKEMGKEFLESSLCKYLEEDKNRADISKNIVEKLHAIIDDFSDCDDQKFINTDEIKKFVKEFITEEKISAAIDCFCSEEPVKSEPPEDFVEEENSDICNIKIDFCQIYWKYLDSSVRENLKTYLNDYIDNQISMDLNLIEDEDVDRMISCVIREVGVC